MVTYQDVVQSGATFHRSALEMILLSQVDHLFITAASTFGGTATLLGYMVPRYVTVDKPYVFEVLLLSNPSLDFGVKKLALPKVLAGKRPIQPCGSHRLPYDLGIYFLITILYVVRHQLPIGSWCLTT
jgi:hypothetical protein